MAVPKMPKPAPDWVQYGDGWVPPTHPLALQAKPTPVSTPMPTVGAATPQTGPKPVTASVPKMPTIGGGQPQTGPKPMMRAPGPGWVQYGNGWVPSTHPLVTGIPDPTANRRAVPPVMPTVPGVPQTTPKPPAAAGAVPSDSLDVPAVVGATALASLPYLGTLRGFEHTKLGDPAHMTIKYQLGRLFAKYPPTPEGMTTLARDPDFLKLGVQMLGGGNIKLPNGSVIDVMTNFQGGGGAWWWGEDSVSPTPPPSSPSPAPGVAPPETGYPPIDGSPIDGTPGSAGYSWNGTTWVDNATGYIWNGTAWVPQAGGAGAYVPGMGIDAPGDYGIPGYDGDISSSEFTDPTTANLESLLNWRINELINPVDDPARQQYANLLQQYIQSLSETDPAITNLVGSLESQAKNYLTPSAFETIGNEEVTRLAGLDPQYQAAANKRLGQLEADPYTGAEWELYRTGVLDPIERDRTAALDRAIAELAQRNIDPSSGIGQAKLNEVNRAFDQSRAVEQGTLGRARVEQRMDRQGEAFDVQTAMDALLNSRRTQRTDLAQTMADWTAGRGERAAQLYGTLADIPVARAQQQLQGAQTLEGLSAGVRGEEQSRRSEALALQGLLAELPERRLQLALAALGEGTSPESMMGSLTSLAGLGTQRQAIQAGQTQASWQGLGSLAAILANMYKPKTTTTATT